MLVVGDRLPPRGTQSRPSGPSVMPPKPGPLTPAEGDVLLPPPPPHRTSHRGAWAWARPLVEALTTYPPGHAGLATCRRRLSPLCTTQALL